MSIYINENDAKLFQDNGFTYDDVNNTVEHYRSIGLNDDEIQNKINQRITEFKTNSNNPKILYGHISSAPQKNIITDFIDCLKWVGNTTMSAYQEGQKQTEIAHLEAKDMFHVINSKEKSRLDYLSETPSKNYQDYGIKDEKYIDENITNFAPRMANKAKKGYVEAINMLPYMWETIKTGGIGTGIGTVGGAAVGAGIGLATTKANTLQLALQGAKYGGSLCGRIAGSAKMAELEGGLARNELKRINQEIIEKGGNPLSELQIDLLAIGVGGVNAGLETVGLRQALKTVPGGDKILQYLEKKNLKELATDLTVREQLGKALAQYAKSIGTEITTEMAQEATNIIAEEIARKLGKIDATPLEENVARVLQTGKATFGAMAFIGGVGTAAKCTSIMIKQGISPKKAAEKTAKMSAEEQSDFVNDNYDTLIETAKKSETELKKDDYIERTYTKFANANVEETESFAIAKLVGQFYDRYGKNNPEIFEKWFNKLEVEYNIPDTERNNLLATNNPEVYFQTVYHGGAKDFDNFDLNYALTGEGAMAHGYGVYLAKNKEVSEGYRKRLSNSLKNTKYNGVPLNKTNLSKLHSAISEKLYLKGKEEALKELNKLKEQSEKNKDKGGFLGRSSREFLEKYNEQLELLNSIDESKITGVNKGQLFEVDISEDDVLLDEYELLSEQNKNVKKLVENIIQKENLNFEGFDPNGRDLYKALSKKYGSDKQASLLLNEYGIKGITYDGRQDGRCYVIFEDKAVDVIKKYYQKVGENSNKDNDINQRNDKTKYLTNNELKQLEKDKNNFQTYVDKLIKGELSYRTQLRVLEKLTSAYNNIPELKNKKVVITQDVYKKIIDLPNKFKKNHNVDRKRAIKLPELIADPLYVLKSHSVGNEHRYVIVTSSKNNNIHGEKLSVILNPNNKVAVVSAYDENIDISKEKKEGRILYDKKKELSKTILTSKARAIDNSDISIADNQSLFNPVTSEQIKSVDNRGMFDEGNANIYFQSEIENTENININKENYLNAQKDISLPHINYQVLKNLGKDDKPLILKSNIIQKNKKNHPELSIEEYNDILTKGLQYTDLVFKTDNKKEYYNFIHFDNSTNEQILVELSENKDNYEIVNFYKFSNKSLERKIKKANNEGGQFLITNSNAKGAAVLSALEVSPNNIITINSLNNNRVTFKQESVEEKLIAGYSYQEIMDKTKSLYDKLEAVSSSKDEEYIFAQIHILEDAFEISENPEKYSPAKISDVMLNAYCVMADQRISDDYLETDKKSQRTFNELKKIHDEKKEKQIEKYYGYFSNSREKKIITIMKCRNKSTALHELGHWFLDGLNELSKASEDAKKQLDEVNKWLGYNGGEYTDKQQERYARSFEAYLYKGKAPNNTLREVFENFKGWLKSVYTDIIELVNQGADISDEVQEMFDKMFSNDQYYQEQKQSDELLNKIKKLGKRKKTPQNLKKNVELDENAKKHKEACYQILSVGTGKSIKYLKSIFESNSNSKAMITKRENIEKLLDKVDDKITVAGGMQQNWLEFFSDTGVSYNNDEVNGSAELVRQAFDRIINRAFNVESYDNYLSERADYFENAIDTANLQLKTLVSAFKNGNRNVALAAIYEWLDSLNPEIKSDFENKIIYEMGAIERNENASKFDIAKRKILKKAMEIEQQHNLAENEKYKETVLEIMKSLNFLQPADKAKLTVNILDVPDVNFLTHRIDNILDIAKTMEDVNLRKMLEIEIHKELQLTKNNKKNGRTVGKYDYKTNKLFEKLREYDRLSVEQANDIKANMTDMAQAEDNGLSFEDKLINKFLSFKAGGRTYSDTELLKSIYDDILKIKLAGKCAKSEEELNAKLDESKDIDELIDIVKNKKNANFALKSYVNIFGNIESTLNAIFNKKIKEKYGSELLYAETQAQAWQHQQKRKFEKEVARIYERPEYAWDIDILKYLSEKYTFPEIRRKYDKKSGAIIRTRLVDRTLTKMDIILIYIWTHNEILNKRLINQFGQNTLDTMFDEMSLKDVKLAELLMSTAQSFYPIVNKTFINKYGLDLPKVSCFFPSTPERGSEIDLFNEYSSESLGNSFTKNRSDSEFIPMDFHNPVAILYNHIDGVSKFVFMSEKLDSMNLRFKDKDLERYIVNKFGEDAHETLMHQLANVTYKKEAPVFNGMNKILDFIVGNWITGNIAIKPIVGLKQLLSANNYAVDMPYMTWQKGFLQAIADYKNTIDYMMNIPYLKARYEGNFSNEFLKQQIENSAFAASKKLKDLCTIFVKIGDIGAIIFGGKPYIDYLINEKGLSEEEAIKQFILSTNRSQQSSAISSLSNFQVSMSRNPIGRLFIAFKNSPQQYVRMCADALISVTNGDMTIKQCAKVLFQYGYVQPLLYTIATSGSLLRFIFTGDDDDLKEDLFTSIFNLNADALPIIGYIYKYAVQKAFNQKALPQSTPLLGDIQTEIGRLAKNGANAEDYLQSIGYLLLHVGSGYNSRAIYSMTTGVGDIATGDIAKGSMKVLGYTDKRAERITNK